MINHKSGYKEIPHTADAALDVWADSLEVLFSNALEGMYQLIGISSNLTEDVTSVKLRFSADDCEELLVTFLSECLYYVFEKRLSLQINSIKICENDLICEMSSFPVSSIEKELKAVTYHNIKIRQRNGNFNVQLTFDL